MVVAPVSAATGGSFRVAGAGSFDSKLVGMRTLPGEIVTVNRDGFDGAALRRLFEAMNAGLRDGHRLTLVE
jgi:hypothetical protein